MIPDNTPIKTLPHPDYSKEEREKIVDYLMALRTGFIREFMASHNIRAYGTKDELHTLVEDCLKDGTLKYGDVVNFIDTVAPGGKQHVFLYQGPEGLVKKWKTAESVNKMLKESGFSKYLNARLALILPEKLALSSLVYKEGEELKISAVERRDYTERREEYDGEKTIEAGKIELRAYLHLVTRGIVIFTWDLVDNTAILQISQLPSGSAYEEEEEKFAGLVNPCLDITGFEKIDMRRAIKKLNELEAQGKPEARSHRIDYRSPGGRTCTFQSSSCRDSILGESEVDDGIGKIRKGSVGRLGNFYWLDSSKCSVDHNPLEGEIHTIMVGDKNRINFTTPNRDEDIKYVLSRVRALCRRTS
ncbi:MAG: hypothetical protein QME51_02500 [Planctomycetota bacterium]|nr:hypothetical protein [Planctomycetota bacterium]MDI6787225.1 hypothetical protein [Planctomycetota bacterium]